MKLMETGDHGVHLEPAVRLAVEEHKPELVSETVRLLLIMVELFEWDPDLSHEPVTHKSAQPVK